MDVIVFKDDYGRIDGRPYILDVRGENFYLTEEEFTGLAVSIVDIVESRRQEMRIRRVIRISEIPPIRIRRHIIPGDYCTLCSKRIERKPKYRELPFCNNCSRAYYMGWCRGQGRAFGRQEE